MSPCTAIKLVIGQLKRAFLFIAQRVKKVKFQVEVGINKRKEESTKTRKEELAQESDQENKNSAKKSIKKTRKQELGQESDKEKKKVYYFFLGRFLGRVLVPLFS